MATIDQLNTYYSLQRRVQCTLRHNVNARSDRLHGYPHVSSTEGPGEARITAFYALFNFAIVSALIFPLQICDALRVHTSNASQKTSPLTWAH